MTIQVETTEHCTLYCGDCLDVLPTLGRVDAVVTDPPYGIGDSLHRPGNTVGNKWSKLYGDGAPNWDVVRPNKCVESLPSICEHAIIWGGNYFSLPVSRGWLIWDKMVREFSSGHAELAWSSLDQPTRAFSYSTGQLVHENKQHPTQKPLPLMKWCLTFLHNADTILDPFMGSGTTGVACVNTGRRFIGIEKEPKYFEIALNRIREAERLAKCDLFKAKERDELRQGVLC